MEKWLLLTLAFSVSFFSSRSMTSGCSGLGERLEVVDALLERVLLLLGGDALPDRVHDPVDHVALLDAAHHVGKLELVVETALHLEREKKDRYIKVVIFQ